MNATLRGRLAELLSAEPDIEAAWLVGSHARGQARPDSDVDVAVLFRAGDGDPFAEALRRGALVDSLEGGLHLPVDVLDIEEVSPAVFAVSMRGAVLLLDRNRGRRIDVASRRYAEWHDMQPHYEMQRQGVRAYFSPRG
jgi:predicted nucleotidyltransferase